MTASHHCELLNRVKKNFSAKRAWLLQIVCNTLVVGLHSSGFVVTWLHQASSGLGWLRGTACTTGKVDNTATADWHGTLLLCKNSLAWLAGGLGRRRGLKTVLQIYNGNGFEPPSQPTPNPIMCLS
jgi:hypothetical protein